MEVLSYIYVFICTYVINIAVICDDSYVQLVDDNADSVFIKDALSRGRVEICVNQTYRTICEDNWNNADASVLCAELGFSPYG